MSGNADLIAQLASAKADVEALREALDFYATSSNWRREVRNVGPRVSWIKSRAAFDRGAKAKFILSQIDARNFRLVP